MIPTFVALDLTNKSVLIPTHNFVKSGLTQKSTTSIHRKSLRQHLVGANYNLAKMYGLENKINTCVNVRRGCMPTEIGSEPTTTELG